MAWKGAEGRYIVNGASGAYEYNLTDHLGNVRAVVGADGTVKQKSNYYPFGGVFAKSGSPDNKYLYNGKELQEGTGWLDYGARMYSADLGRFMTVDPLAESRYWVSGYNYCQNNPISRIDPDGMLDGDYYSEDGGYLGTDGINDDLNYVVTDSDDIEGIVSNDGVVSKGSMASAVELPDEMVTTGISLAKSDSESPMGSDTQGGFHEEGGMYGTYNGKSMVVPAESGKGDERLRNGLSIKTTKAAGLEPEGFVRKGTYHIHTGKKAVQNNSGLIETKIPKAEPSGVDIRNAGKRTSMKGNHYVMSCRDGNLYIYNRNGVLAKFPFSKLEQIHK